jgi:hypothetical protein
VHHAHDGGLDEIVAAVCHPARTETGDRPCHIPPQRRVVQNLVRDGHGVLARPFVNVDADCHVFCGRPAAMAFGEESQKPQLLRHQARVDLDRRAGLPEKPQHLNAQFTATSAHRRRVLP